MAGVKGRSGGKRKNQTGRPKKADEVALIERLSPFEDLWLTKMATGLQSGDFQFVKLYAEYRFGRPTETVKMTSENTNITKIRITDIDGTEL
jgi:hypothetical protein